MTMTQLMMQLMQMMMMMVLMTLMMVIALGIMTTLVGNSKDSARGWVTAGALFTPARTDNLKRAGSQTDNNNGPVPEPTT